MKYKTGVYSWRKHSQACQTGMTFHVKLKTLKYLSARPMVQQLRCMADDVKPVFRENLDHIVFHIGINDVPSKKKHQQKAQEVNSYIKELCKEFNVHYVDHEKSIKLQ